MSRFVIVVLLLSCFVYQSIAIQCYICTYPPTGDCKGPDVPNSLAYDCPLSDTCLKTSTTYEGTTTIARTCGISGAPVKCASDSASGLKVTACYCKGDYCNGANHQATISKAWVLAVALATVLGCYSHL